jgi:protein gp37
MNKRPVFNQTGEGVGWARWTFNPVTGCLQGCPYCFARDIAERRKAQGAGFKVINGREDHAEEPFEPKFWPDRLEAPFNTKLPKSDDIRDRSVFVCSMADLFGEWVPQEWIDQVMDVVRRANGWNYIFLTKNPERYLDIDWPMNCWVGATADTQRRADIALAVFTRLRKNDHGPTKIFLSCEPLLEGIDFDAVDHPGGFNLSDLIDWIIIGGRSAAGGMPAFQPEWEWVEKILVDGHRENLPVWFKDNLTVRPREYPR